MEDPYLDPPVGAGPPTIVEPVPPAQLSSEVTSMRPDVTKAQIIALIVAVLGLASAFGLPLSKEQEDAIIDVAKTLSSVLIAGDAALRIGRNLSDRPSIKP